MLDLVIRGGVVVDGTGRGRVQADVGVADGRVVTVGEVDERAQTVVDADGAIVTPGFVDIHTHLDAQAFWDPTLSPSPLHGVTSVVGGNCGFSIAPLEPASADYLMRMLAKVEGMPLRSLQEGVPWDWSTTGDYLRRLDGELAVNSAFLVGHSALRCAVMGPAARERAATGDEVERMAALLAAALDDGALGFSTSWSHNHKDGDGGPVPSYHADDEEFVALAAVCRRHPGTTLQVAPSPSDAFSDVELERMTAMSLAAQRTLNWNVMLVSAALLEKCRRRLGAGTYAHERGASIVALTLPAQMLPRFTFLGGEILYMLPGWAEPMALPPPQRQQYLQDPANRRRLDELAQTPSPVRHFADWANRRIAETFSPETKRYEGRLVGEIAAEEGKTPFDALLDIVCADELRTAFVAVATDSDDDWRARIEIWRDRRAVLGASDAGAHVDRLSTFNYPTLVLQEAVRNRQLLPLEEAIHLLTAVPAALYGLTGRGTLVPGSAADIVVFDEETVGSEEPRTRFDLPGGAGRLYAGSTGVRTVLVNGTSIVEDGAFTGARPGRVLRSARDTVTSFPW